MTPSRERFAAAAWPLGVVAAVLLANLPALCGLVDTNPLGPVGHTMVSGQLGFLPGSSGLDPEIGWISQALQHRAALDWLHGSVPWWNPFEGLGVPLAAEMQSAAFFPPTLLLALPQGQLYYHVVLELIGGLGTWLLARELGLSREASALGGVLFGLNGTFAMIGNAAVNSVPFLPLMLFAVERIRRRPGGGAGFVVLALSVAAAIYAGFVETVYLSGLLVVAWTIVRLVARPVVGRARMAMTVAAGGAGGVLLSAPVLLPFAEYLPDAALQRHNGAFLDIHSPAIGAVTTLLPWVYGPIEAFRPPGSGAVLINMWGNAGGYITASVALLALFGLFRRDGEQLLRWFLGLGSAVTLLVEFGLPPLLHVVDRLLPLAGDVWVARYVPPVLDVAVVVLACFGAETIVAAVTAHDPSTPWRFALPAAALATVAAAGVTVAFAWPVLSDLAHHMPSWDTYGAVAASWFVFTVATVTALAAIALRRRRAGKSGSFAARGALAVVALDALASFVYPQLSAPRGVTVETGAPSYLAAHLGDGRFFSLDVYFPNYGSYFGDAQLDSNDSPVPAAWNRYVRIRLASNSRAYYFGTHPAKPTGPSDVQQLVANLADYEAVDVRYVVLAAADRDPFGPAEPVVYRDSVATVYRLPSPTNYFSTSGGSCTLDPGGLDQLVAHCTGAADLVRAELEMPGWSATVNGAPAPISSVQDGLQSVRLPAGTSVVRFAYAPRNLTLALGLLLLGALLTSGVPLMARRRRRHATPGAQ